MNLARGFDRLAKPYRWMEYVSFGRALERCRFALLDQLKGTRHALVLGDGDGRFASALLQAAPAASLTAVDISAAMLALLHARCGGSTRCVTVCADLTRPIPAPILSQRYDVVATHFCLDCLTSQQVSCVLNQVVPALTPDARWIVSDFAMPQGPMRFFAGAIVPSLYLAFRLLTGLRVRQLPDHRAAFLAAGFTLERHRPSLGGMLFAEVWRAPHRLDYSVASVANTSV